MRSAVRHASNLVICFCVVWQAMTLRNSMLGAKDVNDCAEFLHWTVFINPSTEAKSAC